MLLILVTIEVQEAKINFEVTQVEKTGRLFILIYR